MANIEDILEGKAPLITFNALDASVKAAGLEYALQGHRPITLFAPSDYAFSKLRQCTIYDLLKHITELRQLIQYHIVPLALTTADLIQLASTMSSVVTLSVAGEKRGAENLQLPTASGGALTITIEQQIQVDGIPLLETDIPADNGIIHIIDSVLWPVDMAEATFSQPDPIR